MTNPNKLADALAARDAAIQEARGWKMEAQTANATIAEIYRLVGSKAGNWNGAKPVREALAGHDAQPAQGEWVMVPRKSTDAMHMAYIECKYDGPKPTMIPDLWAAMLAAAPQPAPAPVQVDDVTIVEGWHGAIGDARELFVNAPDARFKIRAERVVSWLKAHRPVAHPPAPAVDGAGELLSMIDDVAADLTDHKSLAYEKLRKVRAAIAALRQPVPDAVRELPGKWRQLADDNRHYAAQDNEIGRHDSAFALHKGADALETQAAELESALASQQESRK
jgi:hypothetical protein